MVCTVPCWIQGVKIKEVCQLYFVIHIIIGASESIMEGRGVVVMKPVERRQCTCSERL
jgi:hypothetical protein